MQIEDSVIHRIKLGEAELVRTDEEFGDFTLDASFVPLRYEKGLYTFLNTSFCEKPYYHRFVGTPENIFGQDLLYTMDYQGYEHSEPSGVWIMSSYKYEDGFLVGFCHRELISRTDPAFGNCFLIGLAISDDEGASWRYCGDIASNVLNGGQLMANMGGCPLLVRDGYFYVYFNDYDQAMLPRVSAARMKIKETREKLQAGQLPEVFKYTGSGIWKTDPMKCAGASILPDAGVQPDAHSKGVYVKPLDRYFLLMQSNRQAKLMLFISKDCEHFNEHLVIDSAEEDSCMQPFSFFVSTDGDCSDDMNTIGREFYIYYPRKGLLNDERGDFGGYGHDDLYRKKVTILP